MVVDLDRFLVLSSAGAAAWPPERAGVAWKVPPAPAAPSQWVTFEFTAKSGLSDKVTLAAGKAQHATVPALVILTQVQPSWSPKEHRSNFCESRVFCQHLLIL